MKSAYIFISIIFLNLFFLPLKSDEKYNLGKDVFLNKGNCATCHMLSEANSFGQIGPNLDQIKPELPTILNAVTMGVGIMPAFKDMLTDEEIESVSYYVFESTNK
ncbi:cytochrome c [Candidatus Pelagibacter sp.]|nr:cytochrome c [Candidatus Pelagibacter sp.]